MSETKHTPEPWDAYKSTLDGVTWLSISKAGLSIDDEVPAICMVTKIESLNETDVENARRIILCVNACKNLTNGELDDLIHLDGLSLDMLEKTRLERDTAWQELREIREAIKADENESTADEVRSLVAGRDELLSALDSILQHPMDEKNWVAARLIRKKFIQGETCALCGGSGKLDGESCFNCEGTGTL